MLLTNDIKPRKKIENNTTSFQVKVHRVKSKRDVLVLERKSSFLRPSKMGFTDVFSDKISTIDYEEFDKMYI